MNNCGEDEVGYLGKTYVCERCGSEHDGMFGSGKFCSQRCANSHTKTEESKLKTSQKLKGRTTGKAYKIQRNCGYCGTFFEIGSQQLGRKYCSPQCSTEGKKIKGRQNGLKSVQKMKKRSKNEILFGQLCADNFRNVKFNDPMFNGWDADVILEQEKIAVLWNGVWHRKKITKTHSVKQVQNRDMIKIKEITSAGYVPYIIEDNGSYDPDFVKEQFDKFLQWFGELAITQLS